MVRSHKLVSRGKPREELSQLLLLLPHSPVPHTGPWVVPTMVPVCRIGPITCPAGQHGSLICIPMYACFMVLQCHETSVAGTHMRCKHKRNDGIGHRSGMCT